MQALTTNNHSTGKNSHIRNKTIPWIRNTFKRQLVNMLQQNKHGNLYMNKRNEMDGNIVFFPHISQIVPKSLRDMNIWSQQCGNYQLLHWSCAKSNWAHSRSHTQNLTHSSRILGFFVADQRHLLEFWGLELPLGGCSACENTQWGHCTLGRSRLPC